MRYLIVVAFYKDDADKEPIYRVPVNVKDFPDYDFVKVLGFSGYGETRGYFDFRKNIQMNDLADWVADGYEEELKMVLERLYTPGKIQLRLIECSSDSDEPLAEMRICDTAVRFTGTEVLSRVEFKDITNLSSGFHIPLGNLKQYFGVLTLYEVIERMKTFGAESYCSTEFLKDYFESGIDEAISLISEVFRGKRDLDGNPDILHSLAVGMAGQTRNEKITGFLHDVVEDTDITFDNLDDLGYSREVIEALRLLTHDKRLVTYETYVRNIISSGNTTATNVKINDLRNNIARGEAGHHRRIVKKHKEALELILASLRRNTGKEII